MINVIEQVEYCWELLDDNPAKQRATVWLSNKLEKGIEPHLAIESLVTQIEREERPDVFLRCIIIQLTALDFHDQGLTCHDYIYTLLVRLLEHVKEELLLSYDRYSIYQDPVQDILSDDSTCASLAISLMAFSIIDDSDDIPNHFMRLFLSAFPSSLHYFMKHPTFTKPIKAEALALLQ